MTNPDKSWATSHMPPQEINEAVARGLGWIDSDFPVKGRGWIKLEVQPGSWTYLDAYPNYCHDIKAAWEIVDNLHGRYFVVIQESTQGRGWDCGFWQPQSHDPSSQFYSADTAPMAICLAYLKTLGND